MAERAKWVEMQSVTATGWSKRGFKMRFTLLFKRKSGHVNATSLF